VEIARGSPAAAAGLKVRDLITEIDGAPVSDGSGIGQLIEDAEVGTPITVRVERAGRSLELAVTLRLRPTDAP
jgi:S1-C subfamily serine protease